MSSHGALLRNLPKLSWGSIALLSDAMFPSQRRMIRGLGGFANGFMQSRRSLTSSFFFFFSFLLVRLRRLRNPQPGSEMSAFVNPNLVSPRILATQSRVHWSHHFSCGNCFPAHGRACHESRDRLVEKDKLPLTM